MSYALVIDDSRQIADSVCEMLSMLDIEARAAYGPAPGIKAIEEEAPAIVFLDINMPGLPGFEVLRYLRRDPMVAQVPVFIISTENQPEMIEEAWSLGIEDFIAKPFTMDELAAALHKAGLIQ